MHMTNTASTTGGALLPADRLSGRYSERLEGATANRAIRIGGVVARPRCGLGAVLAGGVSPSGRDGSTASAAPPASGERDTVRRRRGRELLRVRRPLCLGVLPRGEVRARSRALRDGCARRGADLQRRRVPHAPEPRVSTLLRLQARGADPDGENGLRPDGVRGTASSSGGAMDAWLKARGLARAARRGHALGFPASMRLCAVDGSEIFSFGKEGCSSWSGTEEERGASSGMEAGGGRKRHRPRPRATAIYATTTGAHQPTPDGPLEALGLLYAAERNGQSGRVVATGHVFMAVATDARWVYWSDENALFCARHQDLAPRRFLEFPRSVIMLGTSQTDLYVATDFPGRRTRSSAASTGSPCPYALSNVVVNAYPMAGSSSSCRPKCSSGPAMPAAPYPDASIPAGARARRNGALSANPRARRGARPSREGALALEPAPGGSGDARRLQVPGRIRSRPGEGSCASMGARCVCVFHGGIYFA
jgi:hypothetical protein